MLVEFDFGLVDGSAPVVMDFKVRRSRVSVRAASWKWIEEGRLGGIAADNGARERKRRWRGQETRRLKKRVAPVAPRTKPTRSCGGTLLKSAQEARWEEVRMIDRQGGGGGRSEG